MSVNLILYLLICYLLIFSSGVRTEQEAEYEPHVVITESIDVASNDIAEDDNDHLIKITDENYSDIVWNHSIVLLLFYTDWCHYSQEMLPTYSQVAILVHQKIHAMKLSPDADEHIKNLTIAFGIVDGDIERDIMSRFHVSKYPTLRMITWGRRSRHEYRGGRSVKTLTKHILSYVHDSVIEMQEKDIQLLHDKISDINSKPIIADVSKK